MSQNVAWKRESQATLRPGSVTPAVDNVADDPVLVPSIERVKGTPRALEPKVNIRVFRTVVTALVDTGSSVSLIGDVIYNRCKVKKVQFRQTKIQLKMASSSLIESTNAVRLRLAFNTRVRRQRFLYLEGMSVPMILGRDFIAGTGMQLDISAGGYKLPGDPTMVPFAELLEQTPHTTEVLATSELLPETLLQQVRDFKGTPPQRK